MSSLPSCRRPSPGSFLAGTRAAVIALAHYPADPRIRRATEALVEAGMLVDLFCLQESADQPRREIVGGVKVTRMRLHRARAGLLRYVLEYARFFLWGLRQLSAAALRRQYHLVHVHNLPDALVFTAVIPKLRGARVILDLHDPMPELFQTIFGFGPRHPLVRLLKVSERCSTAFADLVLTPNRAFRELFAERSSQAAKFRIVMNSPAEEIFHLPSVRPGPPAAAPGGPAGFRLMYHGLIAERHGLDILLHAIKLVSTVIPGVTLDIYGAGSPFLSTVQSLIVRLGLGDRVRYHGKKTLAEIAELIGSIDVGVVPNRRSPFTELNFPTRIFEYLALKKPVVALDSKGVRDYFGRDEIFLMKSDDPAALAALLTDIYRRPENTRQVVERGHWVYRGHRWAREKQRFVAWVAALVTAGFPASARSIGRSSDEPLKNFSTTAL